MTDVNVVIIGGGAMGCSLLYHLAKAGWQRHRAGREERPHPRLHLACRGPVHAFRPQPDDPGTARHLGPALPRHPAGGDGRELRLPPLRRHARDAQPGPHGRVPPCRGPLRVHRLSAGDHRPEAHRRASSAGDARWPARRHLRAGRRPCRSLARHQCHGQGGAAPRRGDPALQSRPRHPPREWPLGGGDEERHASAPCTSSTPPAPGASRSAA